MEARSEHSVTLTLCEINPRNISRLWFNILHVFPCFFFLLKAYIAQKELQTDDESRCCKNILSGCQNFINKQHTEASIIGSETMICCSSRIKKVIFHLLYILNCKINAPCWICICFWLQGIILILYIQINFPAYKHYLCSNFKWFDNHVKIVGAKLWECNFGAYCFLSSCFLTNFSLLVTCIMH